MSLVIVHRYAIDDTIYRKTIEVMTTFDIRLGLTIELNAVAFDSPGTWVLFKFLTLLGDVNTISVINNTSYNAGVPYISGNEIRIRLS